MAVVTTVSDFDSMFSTQNDNMNSKIRVVGAGNTAITINGKLVVLCSQVSDKAPSLTSGTPQVVQGIGDQRPVAIVPGNVQGAGTLTLTFYERYPNDERGRVFWQQILKDCGFKNIDGIYSIAALMGYQRTNNLDFSVEMFLEEPKYDASGIRTTTSYQVKVYHNPIITNVDSNETIDNNKMLKTGTMDIMYTHFTWGGGGSDLSVVSTMAR